MTTSVNVPPMSMPMRFIPAGALLKGRPVLGEKAFDDLDAPVDVLLGMGSRDRETVDTPRLRVETALIHPVDERPIERLVVIAHDVAVVEEIPVGEVDRDHRAVVPR